MLKNTFFLYLLVVLSLTGCAKRGTITGGPKDSIAPTIVGSYPKNMSTYFKGKEIHIDFDEYIKIKDINKQLIISPPLKYQPTITPQGSASKFIEIKIKDTLAENTTYSFNFGQSITDNNEGNPYSQFRFVFSTGSYIDSLQLSGSIKDAVELKPDNFVTVMLYEANEAFNDSTVYKEKPRYVTNTLDSMTNYSLQNLKEGRYYLFALKDASNNYTYDPKSDKIAFLPHAITVPTDSVYPLKLFKRKGDFKPSKPSMASSNRLYLGYEGDARGTSVTVKNGQGTETLTTKLTALQGKDSLQIWLPRDIQRDSLKIEVTHRDSIKNFTVKLKELKAIDTLSIEAVQKGGLNFREKFTLKPATPLTAIDATKITLINKDSIAQPFTFKYDDFKQELVFDFKKQEEEKYIFTMMPGAMTDFYGKQNDTLNYKLTTRKYSDYGNIYITLKNVKHFPVIVQVTDEKGAVKAEAFSDGATEINFEFLDPSKYYVRLIYDDNGNQEWDTGNYMKKLQPEEVLYHPPLLDVKANWDVRETMNGGG
jgi:Bacterial Ig-like domain